MHPPLSRPHPTCQDVINALQSCHEERSVAKWFGGCNTQKAALDLCFKQEKVDRRKVNSAKAKLSQARFLKKKEAKERAKRQ